MWRYLLIFTYFAIFVLLMFLVDSKSVSWRRNPRAKTSGSRKISICPKLLQNVTRRATYSGTLNITNPPRTPVIHLAMILSLQGTLPPQRLTQIKISSSRPLTRMVPIQYRIEFPYTLPPPKISRISLNGRLLCQGPINPSAVSTLVQVEHTINRSVSSEVADSFRLLQTPGKFHKSNGAPTNESCGLPHIAVGGAASANEGSEFIRRGSWPWLAALYVHDSMALSYQCGGNLISSNLVLTSAHCFRTPKKAYAPDVIFVYLGKHDLNNWMETGSLLLQSEEIHTHPDFEEDAHSYDSDLSVVRITSHVTFSKYIRPVCISWPESAVVESSIGLQGQVVGWGQERGGHLSATPVKTVATVVESIMCLQLEDSVLSLGSDKMFCAETLDVKCPCNGFSGAGFMILHKDKWFLKGIVSASVISFQDSHSTEKYVVIYTDVSKHWNWIQPLVNSDNDEIFSSDLF